MFKRLLHFIARLLGDSQLGKLLFDHREVHQCLSWGSKLGEARDNKSIGIWLSERPSYTSHPGLCYRGLGNLLSHLVLHHFQSVTRRSLILGHPLHFLMLECTLELLKLVFVLVLFFWLLFDFFRFPIARVCTTGRGRT